MRLKPAGKLIILLVVIGLAAAAWQMFGSKLAPTGRTTGTVSQKPIPLPPGENGGETNTGSYNPTGGSNPEEILKQLGATPGCTDKPQVKLLHWAWNAQMGLMLATGGPQSTEGSLMCKHGVNLLLERQDDPSKMQEELVTFATELSRGNPQPTKGAHFVAIMGDGGAAFLKAVNDNLRRLGPEYVARVVGSAGYSRGEDKFMGPPEWKTNPAASRGGVVAGVLRDGDWNIAQKWLADNGLKTNTDEKTYDPDALNWIASPTYLDAAEKYIAGYSEERPVVRNGRRTGERKRITVNGVVTWTPGDVNIAQKKGGLVSIVSTKEYSSQMPNTIIGINKWMQQNRPMVEGMLQAICEAGETIKKSPQAFDRAAEISAAVYQEQGADKAYWKKYFQVVKERDVQGLEVELGGSSVNTIGDNLLLFGLKPGAANIFAAVYTAFGDVVKSQYPDLVPNYPPVSEILDTSYIKAVANRMAVSNPGVTKVPGPIYIPPTNKKQRISTRQWNIQFATGSDTFTGGARRQLELMRRDLLIASGATVEIEGHTDNVGNPITNQKLSEDRAFAVRNWLMKTSPVNFPERRFQISAYGQTKPTASNSTPQGRARNRRVEIILRAAGG
jgi:OmpA-OmpF porin, OOP family